MPHATHQARRTGVSAAPHVPLASRGNRRGKQALLIVSVGLTSMVIIALYAATFPARIAQLRAAPERPRWTLLEEDLLDRLRPAKDQLAQVRETLTRMAGAGRTQAEAAAILKAKVQAHAAASASSTPNVPETPETP